MIELQLRSTKELKQAEAEVQNLKGSEAERQRQIEVQFTAEREELAEKLRSAERKEAASSESAKAAETELTSYKVVLISTDANGVSADR